MTLRLKDMRKLKWLKPLIKPLLFSVIFLIICFSMTDLFQDKRTMFPWDITSKVKGFYNEPENTLDFIFVGSSHMITSLTPAVLWKEYGITSYNFSATQQPFWISYHYIKEAIKYQQPKAVVLDIRYSVFNREYVSEGQTRLNLDDLKFSLNKIQAINNSVPKSERLSYYLDFIKYHSNWGNLKENHFQDISDFRNPYKGYTPLLHYRDYPKDVDISYSQTAERADIPERSREFLMKIINLSREEDFNLLLIKTPDSSSNAQRVYNTVAEMAKANGVPFINYNTIMPGEGHNNIINAEKFTSHLGAYLVKNYKATDKRGLYEYSSWHEDSKYFYQEKQKYLLRYEKNLKNYLELIDNPHYLVCVSVKDEASNNLKAVYSELDAMGFMQNLKEKYRHSYVGIIDSNEVLYENVQDKSIEYDLSIYDLNIKLVSQGFRHGNSSSIVINGKEYSKNKRGLNIVVYDKFLKEVVDSVAFDTCDQLQCFR